MRARTKAVAAIKTLLSVLHVAHLSYNYYILCLPLVRHRGSSRCAPQARTRSWPFGDDPHGGRDCVRGSRRSEEHTSELQSLMRISYAVFCLKKKNQQ